MNTEYNVKLETIINIVEKINDDITDQLFNDNRIGQSQEFIPLLFIESDGQSTIITFLENVIWGEDYDERARTKSLDNPKWEDFESYLRRRMKEIILIVNKLEL